MKPAPEFKPARPGDRILVTIPNYWSRSTTFEKAIAWLKAESGVRLTARTPASEMHVFSVHPSTYCNEVDGGISSPEGHPPVRLNP